MKYRNLIIESTQRVQTSTKVPDTWRMLVSRHW